MYEKIRNLSIQTISKCTQSILTIVSTGGHIPQLAVASREVATDLLQVSESSAKVWQVFFWATEGYTTLEKFYQKQWTAVNTESESLLTNFRLIFSKGRQFESMVRPLTNIRQWRNLMKLAKSKIRKKLFPLTQRRADADDFKVDVHLIKTVWYEIAWYCAPLSCSSGRERLGRP